MRGRLKEKGELKKREKEGRKEKKICADLVLPCVCLSSAALAGGRARTKVPAKIKGREEEKRGGEGKNFDSRAVCLYGGIR